MLIRMKSFCILLCLPFVSISPGNVYAAIQVRQASIDPAIEHCAPGLYFSSIVTERRLLLRVLPDLSKPVPDEPDPCAQIRLQRTSARVGFASVAAIGAGLIWIGYRKSLENIFSGDSEGSFASVAGLFLIAGSAVGYAIVIPSLNRKSSDCRE